MVQLIYAEKGSGKTKRLIDLANAEIAQAKGDVVFIDDDKRYMYDVKHNIRFVDVTEYDVKGEDEFYGFLCGICAGDHDITDVLIDATLRIGSRDYNELAAFLKKVDELSKNHVEEKSFIFTISADEAELPVEIFDFCKKL